MHFVQKLLTEHKSLYLFSCISLLHFAQLNLLESRNRSPSSFPIESQPLFKLLFFAKISTFLLPGIIKSMIVYNCLGFWQFFFMSETIMSFAIFDLNSTLSFVRLLYPIKHISVDFIKYLPEAISTFFSSFIVRIQTSLSTTSYPHLFKHSYPALIMLVKTHKKQNPPFDSFSIGILRISWFVKVFGSFSVLRQGGSTTIISKNPNLLTIFSGSIYLRSHVIKVVV